MMNRLRKTRQRTDKGEESDAEPPTRPGIISASNPNSNSNRHPALNVTRPSRATRHSSAPDGARIEASSSSSPTNLYSTSASSPPRVPARAASASPYYATEELHLLDSPGQLPNSILSKTLPSQQEWTRSIRRSSQPTPTVMEATAVPASLASVKPPPSSRASVPVATNSQQPQQPPVYFGTRNTRKSLEDDDPADTNSTTDAHFNLRAHRHSLNTNSPELSSIPSTSSIPTPTSTSARPVPATNASTPASRLPSYESPPQASSQRPQLSHQPRESSFSALPNSPYAREAGRRRQQQQQQLSPTTNNSLSPASSGEQKPPARSSLPMSSEAPSSTPAAQQALPSSSSSEVATMSSSQHHAVASAVASRHSTAGDDSSSVALCTEHYRSLLLAAGDASSEYNFVQDLLTVCKKDQEELQQQLNSALEDADFGGNLEELFALNDGIVSAIDAGEKALKNKVPQPPQPARQKSSVEEPSIDLLVENEDIFSLICMLRSSDGRKLASALALMKFARDSEPLRNEIRSSGGLHSFLTLFRSNRPTREIQVVASLAIAYILPSFVVSSQTSATLGLKIIECLCSLVAALPINPRGVSISREEMIKAASLGVNIVWINVVQPLVNSNLSKIQIEPSPPAPSDPALAVPKTKSIRRQTTRDLFDQGQGSIEIKELAELSVALIVHVARVVVNENLQVDPGYDIVEEICKIDVARPIVVREGLLKILISWLRSKDIQKIRPAASALRYLISIDDRYMAGWIHSQVVNESGVDEIVKLLGESIGPDIRLAVAEMISALCVASHTRAAVVEARVVSYLVALLYDHGDLASHKLVECAAGALVQLAAGAMTRTNAIASSSFAPSDPSGRSQRSVVSEIVESCAHETFVQIVKDHKGEALRTISIEALRVLSEDLDSQRQTRLCLCKSGAAEALGITLKDNMPAIEPLIEADEGILELASGPTGELSRCLGETHEALCALANMFGPRKRSRREQKAALALFSNPQEVMARACLDLVKSDGLSSIIWISSLSYLQTDIAKSDPTRVDRPDILEEACRVLASISPLLLSETAASDGQMKWANDVFDALHNMLQSIDRTMKELPSNDRMNDLANDLTADALRGLCALAVSEPLKMKIVDQSLPALLTMKNFGEERGELSAASNQVLLALGFTDDELTAQVAGNNPDLLVDWFCLQRSFLIQAMARREIRRKIQSIWRLPFEDVSNKETVSLIRQVSGYSQKSSSDDEDTGGVIELFESFTFDYDSHDQRDAISKAYTQLYGTEEVKRGMDLASLTEALDLRESFKPTDDKGLLSKQIYPFGSISTEKEWVIGHARSVKLDPKSEKLCSSTQLPDRLERLLDFYFPSKLLQNEVIPLADLRPGASFNFRALMMPQRRYFSFRREGQLLSRLCEKQASMTDDGDIHWTIGFTNSTFAGEFVESLVQALYLCPMIVGLSFAKNSGWSSAQNTDNDIQGDEGGGLLANLVGSIPPWVAHMTFDGILTNRDLRALTAIIEMMGNLAASTTQEEELPDLGSTHSQGKFLSLNIRNSPDVEEKTWKAFFKLLGRSGPNRRTMKVLPLSSLKALDLSGNKLGDVICGHILELVHEKDSGCTIEQLDLSGNRIGRGSRVVDALKSYVEYYRYNQSVGVNSSEKSWLSSLHTLNLSENDLFLGQAALEIIALLKNNALCLRSLDLSNNSLKGDYQLLTSCLKRNTSLCHLNMSGNNFGAQLLNAWLDEINSPDFDSGLSFLRLENNNPSLTDIQRGQLATFLKKSRKVAIERYLHERERVLSGDTEPETPSKFDPIDDNIMHESGRINFGMGRRASRLLKAPGLLDTDQLDNSESVDVGDNMITVLFSAPLVFTDEHNQLHPFAKLDFEMERELLWQCMKEASRDIGLTFDNAHHSRLLATLTRRCSCLHYSGHGHPNFLPFEDGMGGPNWLDVQDIKKLIVRDGVAPFKFVFVSACHSGLAGETFASAGVPHVVCCRQESELKDTAALAFTRQFYLALVVGHTVKESFEQGCKAVRATPNLRDPEKEMEKFVLLPKDGDHDVPVFKARPVSEWPKQPRSLESQRSARSRRGSSSRLLLRNANIGLRAKTSELSVRNMIQEDPSPTPPQFFMGREVELYYILTAILKLRKRLVSVLGETGVGRSSLACALCHYINERASTISEIQRIYFIKPRHGGRNVTCRSLLLQLLDQLKQAGKSDVTEEDQDTEELLDIVCRSLKNDKVLIVFDHTELLEKSDEEQELPMILSTLLYDTKHTKVLLTGRHSLGQPSVGGQVEHQFNLGPLNFANSVKLFANLCPLFHTPSERGALLDQLTRDFEDEAHLLPSDPKMSEKLCKVMSMLGDGVPAKIEKAAYRLSKDDLAQLYSDEDES